MLRSLFARENGVDPPNALVQAEITRRSFTLELSKYVNFQEVHAAGVNCLDVENAEHRYVLGGAADGVVSIHDLHNTSGNPQCTLPLVTTIGRGHTGRHKFSVETVQWYPRDSGLFMTSGMDKKLKVWDANTLTVADQYKFEGVVYNHHMSPVSTRHCLIATASRDNKVQLIDLKAGSATHELTGHRKPVLCTRWSTKDEFLLASGSEDGRVLLYDIRRAKAILAVLDQHNGDSGAGPNSVGTAHNGHVNSMAFTSDGHRIVTFGTDAQVRLWNTGLAKNTNVNFGRVSNRSRKCIKLCISQDCRPDLVFIPAANHIAVFELFSGTEVATLRGHYNQVNCCYQHPLTQELYSGANDRNILFWVPETDAVTSYEEHLRESSKDKRGPRRNFTQRTAATADMWSSEED